MTTIFVNILNWINGWVGNYGWAVIVFTLFVKLVLLPLDIKSRKSMRAMSMLNPQLEVLKKRYANDQEKLNRKTQELYRNNHVNPLSGCLPILIQMPILIIMFTAMRRVAAQQQVNMVYEWAKSSGLARLAEDGSYIGLNWAQLPSVSASITEFTADFGNTQSWFWIKSVFQADNMNRFVIPTVSELSTTLNQYSDILKNDDALSFVNNYVNALGLTGSDKISIISTIINSLNVEDGANLIQSITAFINEESNGVTLDTLLAQIQTAGISGNAYDTIHYVLAPSAGYDNAVILEYLGSLNGVDASLMQHINYLLSSNATTTVFGTRIDTALADTVDSYKGSILGFISISFPTKFNRYVNGYYVLPILACATQVLASKLQPATPDAGANKPAKSGDSTSQAAGSTGKIMKWLFPIMSLWICWSSTAAFAIYWVFVNVWSIVSSYGINFYLSNKEKKDQNKPSNDTGKKDKNTKEALQP
ncbi:MAG: membrane protein insertase YidC [Clostridia bacterium]|nr:membrane protein insertase YidC [Clostridia bacterium]